MNKKDHFDHVSIIIPCYNAKKWIAESIQSALRQTWSNKEVIVVDDGSNDGSLEVIRSFGEAIRWESGPNRGGCAARNSGLQLAKGKWVQFLDADDVLLPDCLEQKLAIASSPSITTCCGVSSMNENDKTTFPSTWNLPYYDLETMLRSGTPQTSSPIHLKENLLRVGGFREGLSCSQERDLHLRLAIELDITFLSTLKVGVLIRSCPDSVSRSAGIKMPLAIVEVLMRAMDSIESRGKSTVAYRDAFAQHITRLARILWRMGATKEAQFFADKARMTSPQWAKGAYNTRVGEIIVNKLGFSFLEWLRSRWRIS